MKLYDLTHPISDNMPVYPGTEAPVITTPCSVERDGFLEKKICLYSHTGTHIDAPAHLFVDGKTLDQYPIDHFSGPAYRLDLGQDRNRGFDEALIYRHADAIYRADFLILNSGWSRHWGSPTYFENYPVLSQAAAELITSFQLKGMGLDQISVDAVDNSDLPIHRILLKHELILIENLANLDRLPSPFFTLSVLPLKLKDADGSPVRAVGFIQ